MVHFDIVFARGNKSTVIERNRREQFRSISKTNALNGHFLDCRTWYNIKRVDNERAKNKKFGF